MKTQSTIFAAAALLLVCITPSRAADPAAPDFMKEVVIKAAPPLAKEQRAGREIGGPLRHGHVCLCCSLHCEFQGGPCLDAVNEELPYGSPDGKGRNP